MGDFNFLNESNKGLQFRDGSTVEEDHIAKYFKMRQEYRKDSLETSSRASSLSLLSLNTNSLFNDLGPSPINQNSTAKLSLDANTPTFKKPKTPPAKRASCGGRSRKSTDSDDAENMLMAELAKADDVMSRVKRGSRVPVASDRGQPAVLFDMQSRPSWSPRTPMVFRDELGSITPDPSLTSINPRSASIADFPLRDEGDILDLLKKDEKKFVPNTSGFSHNSDIINFSLGNERCPSSVRSNGVADDQLSIGEFFARRSDSIGSITKGIDADVSECAAASVNTSPEPVSNRTGHSTMSAIHQLLQADGLSGTAICEELLKARPDLTKHISMSVKDLTLEASRINADALSQSRQSTPLAVRTRTLPSSYSNREGTPVRRGRDRQPARLPFNSSTPLAMPSRSDIADETFGEMSQKAWQQMRQTQVEEKESKNEYNSVNETLKDDGGGELEQTIAAGDLTTLSQRIEGMPPSRCTPTSTPRNTPLLGVVKKLAHLPTGTIDCTALTPLIRHEFPQLLVDCKINSDSKGLLSGLPGKFQAANLSSNPGSWVELCNEPQSVTACVLTKKLVPLPMCSKELWLLVRISAVEVVTAGQTVRAERHEETWVAGDLLTLRAKEVVLPPGIEHRLHLSLVCQKELNSALRVVLQATDLHSTNTQQLTAMFFLGAAVPSHGFTISPTPSASFGTLPESCYEDHPFKLVYSGDCDVPVRVYIHEENSASGGFLLKNNVLINGEARTDIIWKDGAFQATLTGGKKQALEFDVRFCPRPLPEHEVKGSYEGEVRVELSTTAGMSVPIARTRLHGAVAFAKFLCRADCSPVVFHATTLGQSISKPFHLKNAGAIPLKVALQVAADPSNAESPGADHLFSVPKMVAIPLDESVSFNITFTPDPRESYSRRYLIMNIEPNGKTSYDVELIGTVPCHPDRGIRSSRSSVKSSSTATSAISNGLPVKLTASNSALSWMAVPLQKSVFQSFQVKIKSQASATARISISPESDAFKIMNEKGEALSKVRKTLKPEVPMTVNVRFKPDSIGLYSSVLAFAFNSSSTPSLVQLTGFGGCPKLHIEDTLLDLHGNRMVKLQHPRSDSFVFSAQFRVTNYGNAPGFVLITPSSNVLSISHALKVYPLQFVLEPNSNVIINLSQHLTRVEFRDILSGQEIRKVATLNVIMGDEPSRQRLRKYFPIESSSLNSQSKRLIVEFSGEKKIDLDGIKESKDFESSFMSNLTTTDVVAVLEKSGGVGDQTAIDLDESSQTFTTLSETVIVGQMEKTSAFEQLLAKRKEKSPNESVISAQSQARSQDLSDRKVQDWLRKVE